MRVFSRKYNFISLEVLLDALKKKDLTILPPKSLLITFDDGHKGNADLLDIFRDHNIKAAIYAVAGIVNTSRHFWWIQASQKTACSNQASNHLSVFKNMPDVRRREILAGKYHHYDQKEYEAPHALSLEDIDALLETGAIIGSHTLFHPMLDRCSDDVGLKECVESRKVLEKLIKRPVLHFAYPDGNGGKSQSTRKWIQDAGYLTARTTVPGWVVVNTDLLRLPNFGVADNAGPNKALVQACGLWDLVIRKLNCRKQRRPQSSTGSHT